MALPVALQSRFMRWLADPRFQRLAVRLPVGRSVARHRARRLFALTTGFVGSQILLAVLRTGLLDALREGPRGVTDLAAALEVDETRMMRLLEAAVALDLVRVRGSSAALGRVGAEVLGNPGARAMIEHHDALYADLAQPERLLRPAGGEPGYPDRLARLWSYDVPDAEDRVAAYSELMTRSQSLLADDVLAVLPLAEHRVLLDVGGGEGAFAAAALCRHAHLRVMVFDLPAVAAAAGQRARRLGLEGRLTAHAGSFFTDKLPEGADSATLIRVLHDHDDAPALELLRAVRGALPRGALVAVAEPMAGVDPAVDAYFAAYFLAMGRGRLRSPDAVGRLLERAGMRHVRPLNTRMPLLAGVVTALA